MKCFYHSADLDGKCSGAIVKARFSDCEMIGYDYGEAFPWTTIGVGEKVIMIDVSLPIPDMMTLATLCDLTWIDHHQRVIEEAQAANFKPEGPRIVGLAACEIAWTHFMAHVPMPRAVRLLGRWDVWDHADPECEPFQMGMKMRDNFPGAPIWADMFKNHKPDVDEIVEDGRLIVAYQRKEDTRVAIACAFEARLDGMAVIAMNSTRRSSQAFEGIYDAKRHAMMVSFFLRKDGQWVVSLYTTHAEVDCSATAKAHKGGGHRNAAGFNCSELPFKFANKEPVA